jgi:hypothetical protein
MKAGNVSQSQSVRVNEKKNVNINISKLKQSIKKETEGKLKQVRCVMGR